MQVTRRHRQDKGKWRGETLAKRCRGETKPNKKERGKAEKRALIVVLLYSPVPAGAVAATGVLVAASRVITVVAAPAASAGAGMAAPLRTTDAHTHRDQHMYA